ncbi:mandelate racemase [Brucella endophytica]|uniref:Mandelate racemase n=2 Tax=Brucella endophytica TaxID=1963359 RepID=A0A916S6T9_9HYPH|nr:enolase C-terminal domain-like protein [Brucella endophytica]GGA86989.1 mandelate racemase [Brucella endophytica]
MQAVKVRDAALFERRVTMRTPFRFGAATVNEASQLFLRLTIEDGQGRYVNGYAAELMVPKWFDKNPALGQADNEEQLRRSVCLAVKLAGNAPALPAFALHTALEGEQHRLATAEGLNRLVASFGLALVDRAVLDALCRWNNVPVTQALRENLPEINAETTPDLAGSDIDTFLAQLKPEPSLVLRHTVGYVDALTPADLSARHDDGLPECLEEEIRAYGLTCFKLKVSGRPLEDVARLKAIAAVLDRQPKYLVTLDGNEQFEDEEAAIELIDRIEAEPSLKRLRGSLLFLEQPFPRATALSRPVTRLAQRILLEIDESDGTPDAFLEAKAQGYRGVSSKSCKGFYRSLLNRMRVEKWNTEGDGFFMSAEDLTTQAGIAVQQDLALAAILRLGHVERNGHHYVDGMQGAGEEEVRAWLDAHGDLYRQTADGRLRLDIKDGRLDLGTTLHATGLGISGEAAAATFTALEKRGS